MSGEGAAGLGGGQGEGRSTRGPCGVGFPAHLGWGWLVDGPPRRRTVADREARGGGGGGGGRELRGGATYRPGEAVERAGRWLAGELRERPLMALGVVAASWSGGAISGGGAGDGMARAAPRRTSTWRGPGRCACRRAARRRPCALRWCEFTYRKRTDRVAFPLMYSPKVYQSTEQVYYYA